MRLWTGQKLGFWIMWGITWKTSNKWWFFGISREYRPDRTLGDSE